MDHPEQFTCQEKVDGSNLFIGRTNGKLWVSRKSAANPIYIPDEWGNMFWVQNFKFAHKALIIMENELVKKFGDTFELEAEILSILFPNTINYACSNNQIVIFNPEVLNLDVRTTFVDTVIRTDGHTLHGDRECFPFQIKGVQTIPQCDWVPIVREIRTPTPEYYTYDLLVEKLVKNRFSIYTDSFHMDVRIEGLVFRHTDGWLLKLVDRKWFTKLNTENYAFRKKIFRTPGAKSDSIMDVFTRDSVTDLIGSAEKAIEAVTMLQTQYKNDNHNFVCARNREALFSVKDEMQALIDGR